MNIRRILCMAMVLALSMNVQGQTVGELKAGGAAAVKACCLKLNDVSERPGKDDTAARTALHGVCANARVERIDAMVEDGILAAWPEVKQPEIKMYLLEQLYYTAGAKSVPMLSGLLSDDAYVDAAAKVLVAIPDGRTVAGSALLRALPGATGICRHAVVQALGDLQVEAAAEAVAKDTASLDRRMRLIAFEALSRMNALSSTAAFEAWIANSGKLPRYERSVVDGALEGHLKNLVAWGRGAAALKLVNDWKGARAGDVTVACAALETYDALKEVPEANRMLVSALAHEQLRVRLSALRLLKANLTGERLRMIADLLDAKVPQNAPQILELLAQGGDKSMLPKVDAVMFWEDREARAAAIQTAVKMQGAGSLGRLPNWLGDKREGVAEAAAQAVCGIPGSLADALVALSMKNDGEIRVALLDIIERRKETAALAKVADLAKFDDLPVRQALCKLFGAIGDEKALPFLLGQLQAAGDNDKWMNAAEKGTLTLCRRLGDSEGYLTALQSAYAKSAETAKPSLLKAISLAGNAAALDTLAVAWKTESNKVKEAALRMMMDWPNAAALGQLREIAKGEQNAVWQVLAFRGCVRLVPMQAKAVPAKADDMAGLLALARRQEERNLVVESLGTVEDGKSMSYLLEYVKDDSLKAVAAVSVVNLSERLMGAECVAPLRSVMPLLDDRQKERASKCLATISANIGKVMKWEVSGVYRMGGKGYTDLQNIAFAPEKAEEAGKVAWKKADCDKEGRLNLNAAIENAQNVTGYARCILQVPAATKARFLVGSDDSVKVWLNGKVVDDVNGPNAFVAGRDNVLVELRAGRNEVLCKVGQGGGDWMVGLKVCAEDNGPLADLVIALP